MEYDKNKYKVISWTNWRILNWIINPGLAVNELILGQRIPRVLFIEKKTNEEKSNNLFVSCSHCSTIHREEIWSDHNALKNWFGLYCPSCGKTIPCIRNFISLAFIVLTAPLWIWFVKKWKQKWMAKQPERYNNINFSKVTEVNGLWLKVGFSWAGLMYILSIFINPLITGEEINKWLIIIGIPVWTLGGFCLTYVLQNLNWQIKTA